MMVVVKSFKPAHLFEGISSLGRISKLKHTLKGFLTIGAVVLWFLQYTVTHEYSFDYI